MNPDDFPAWIVVIGVAVLAALAACWVFLPFILMSRMKGIHEAIHSIETKLLPLAENLQGYNRRQLAAMEQMVDEGPVARLVDAQISEQLSALVTQTRHTNELLEWLGSKNGP